MFSNAGVWNRQGEILRATLAADESSVYEPCVIYDTNPQILSGLTNVFKMWFGTGWLSTPNIGYAESPNGIDWTRGPNVTSGNNRAHAGVLKVGSTYYMYAPLMNACRQIDLLTSTDGVNWTLANSAVLSVGSGWDSAAVVNPNVFVDTDGVWKMVYEGRSSGLWLLGLATSPDGVTWTKYASNPVLGGVDHGGPDVHNVGGTYCLWSHGGYNGGLPTDLWFHKSSDLKNWSQSFATPVAMRYTADEGSGSGNAQLADPFAIEVNGTTYIYYSASADGNQTSGNMHIKLLTSPNTLASVVDAALQWTPAPE